MTSPDSLSLMEAASRYLAGFSGQERQAAQAEIVRFARWCGADRPVGELSGHEVSTYAETVGGATVDATRRLEHLQGFLRFVRKRGLTTGNLATHVRSRKTGSPSTSSTVMKGRRETQLTAEGYAALEADLVRLRGERPRLAEELRRAMADKDFRENAPLDAIRDHQAMVEGRIRDIEGTLRHAVIAEAPSSDHKTQLGSTVVVKNLASGREMRYTLVSPSEVNPAEGKISAASPVGKALLEKRPGDEVEVAAPAGTLRLRVERIEA